MKAYAFKWITAVCLLMTCVQLAVASWLWQNPVLPAGAPTQGEESSTAAAAATAIQETAAMALTATFARPMFEPGRRPFMPKVEEPQAEPVEQPALEPEVAAAPDISDPSQLRLMGVLKTATVEQVLIATLDNPSGDWFFLDAEVIGWKIKVIAPNSVTLEAHGKTFVLEHYQQVVPQLVE